MTKAIKMKHSPFHDINTRILKTYIPEKEEVRGYIGASSIGHTCDRKIWLQWRGNITAKECMPEELYAKRQRIFERGKEEEEKIIKRLERAGYIIEHPQKQLLFATPTFHLEGFATAHNPNFFGLKGHIDGMIVDPHDPEKKPYILEIKTAKESSYKGVLKYYEKLKKQVPLWISEDEKNGLLYKGLEEIYPQYIIQVQVYMFLSEINQAIILIINKNTDDLQSIIIEYNPDIAEGAIQKTHRISSMDSLPLGIKNEEKQPYQCKMCEFKNYCYK